MALERPIKVWGVEQRTKVGVPVSRVVGWPADARTDVTAETFAVRFAAAARKEWFERGSLTPALRAFPELTCETTSLIVAFPPQRGEQGAPGRPAMSLHFDVVIATLPTGGTFALIPLQGTGAHGADRAGALTALERRVRMEAGVARWLEDGATLWPKQIGDGLELVPVDESVYLHTFNEVRELQKAKEEAVVPRFTTRLVARGRAWLREAEVTEVNRVVRAAHPTSLLLVGPSNAGRTSVFHEVVHRGGMGVVLATHASRMVLALTRAGGWQDALARACEELTTSGAWLWVDHVADLFEVGRHVGNSVSMAEFLRPWLARGQVRIAGEATPEEVARIEARAPGWLEAFTRVAINEPNDALPMVEAWATHRHGASGSAPSRIAPGAAAEALRLGRRFSPYAGYPGKTIRFLDARAAGRTPADGPVDRDVVIAGLCAESGLPRMIVDAKVPLPTDAIEAWFTERVFGQPDAVRALVETLAAVKADLAPRGRPIASMLLVGPTGVGKTETARALTTFLFGDASRMTRFDMSEYSSPHAVLRLCGVGDEEGRLTSAIRRQPFSVLLFDEVEKAHPSFLDLLLQLLGEGRLTDGRGKVADACACLVLLTSNVGAAEARRTPTGFDRGSETSTRIDRTLAQAVSAWLRPELQNRLDRVLLYRPLGEDAVGRVLDRELAALSRRSGLADRSVTVEGPARQWLIQRGVSPGYGARPLQRALHDALVAPLALELAAWRRPGPPVVRVELTRAGEGVRIVLSEGARVSAPSTGGYEDLERLLDIVRAVRDTNDYDRLALAMPRARRRRIERQGHVPAVEETLVADLDALHTDLQGALVSLGARWLQGLTTSTTEILGFQDRLLAAVRAIVDYRRPLERTVTLGIYGADQDKCVRMAEVYTDALVALGLQVTRRTVHRSAETTVKFKAVLPGEKPPSDWPETGVELEITGAAAGPILEEEGALHEIQQAERAARLRVVYYAGAVEKMRSPGLVRRAGYDGKPDKEWPAGAHFLAVTDTLRDTRALTRRLAEALL
jgi:hypothetical protein